MKTLIIRKPKFMRDDRAMLMWVNIAELVTKEMDNPELTLDQKFDLLTKLGECFSNAAKVGGFLRRRDFINWMIAQTCH